MMKTINSHSLSETIPGGKRTRLLLCLIVGFLLTSGAPGILFAESGLASFYSTEACRFNSTKKCLTADGESLYDLERTKQDFAATWNYPMGSRLKITNLRNGKNVIVRVVDRGPAKRLHRIADLSRSSFRKISSLKKGVIHVSVQPVS